METTKTLTTGNIEHVATIAGYPIKDELGGGFRGVYLNRVTRNRIQSDVLSTLSAAKFWAQTEAHRHHEIQNIAQLNRRGEYQANIWVRT